MQFYGELLLGFAFLWTAVCAGAAFLGARFRRQNLIDSSRYGLYALVFLFWAMALILSYTFITSDFSNKYVVAYSDRGMSTFYRLAAFWGGEKGALLLWTLMLSTFSAISIHTNRNKAPRWIGATIGILLVSIGFFELLMITESNPFETFLTSGGPADGDGMNPLLQTPTMLFHPPALLTGYITFTIPFAYGLAALLVNKLDTEWIRVTRFWTLVSWLFLSLGLILGGLWAYQEQGWGGVWMWDAVENAGLIPWFTATAFLHSVMIQERRGMLKRWNAILVCMTFLLTIFGTFLTRSQLIVSIHAFADSELPNYFFGYMIGIVIISATAVSWRWKELKSDNSIESFWSRESFFILNNVILVACAFIVIYGTIFPKVSESEAFRESINGFLSIFGMSDSLTQAVDLGEPWFNKVMIPLFLPLLFLTGAGPIIAWKRATMKNFKKNFIAPILLALIPTLLAIVILFYRTKTQMLNGGVDEAIVWTEVFNSVNRNDWMLWITFFIGFFVIMAISIEYKRAIAVRRKKIGGSRFMHFIILTLKARRRFGGYIVHIGVVMCFFGLAGKAISFQLNDQVMNPGDVVDMENYRATFAKLEERFEPDGRFVSSRATMVITDRGSSVDKSVMEEYAAVFEKHNLNHAILKAQEGRAKIHVHFEDDENQQMLLGAGLFISELHPLYERLPDDTEINARVYKFRDSEILSITPMSFMRHVNELKSRVASLYGLGVVLKTTPGSTVVQLIFDSKLNLEYFNEVEALALDFPETLNIRPGDGFNEVELISAKVGRHLYPEVRKYEKHETPTTEVAIESHFFEDLYLAIRPSQTKSFISVAGFVNPLMTFLWIGAVLLLFGATIALTPNWITGMLPSGGSPNHRRQAEDEDEDEDEGLMPIAKSPPKALDEGPSDSGGLEMPKSPLSLWLLVGASLVFSAVGISVETARARQAIAAAPTGYLVAQMEPGDPASNLPESATKLMFCPIREGGSWSVKKQRRLHNCETSEGERIREMMRAGITELGLTPSDLETPNGKAKIFDYMVKEDPRVDTLLDVPMGEFNAIFRHAKCLCGCAHILFQCGPECGPVNQLWRGFFRRLLTAGYSPDAALSQYVDYYNQGLKPSQTPYNLESIQKDPGKASTWRLPLLLGIMILLLLYIFVLRGRKPSTKGDQRAVDQNQDQGLINDLLDEVDDPLD